VSQESVEREAGSCFVILRSGKTGPFRGRWKLRILKTRLAIAFGAVTCMLSVGSESIMEIPVRMVE